MSEDGSSLAMGDESGKIFSLANLGDLAKRNFVIQTLHWHANGASSLRFVPNTPFLMSGGAESVLV